MSTMSAMDVLLIDDRPRRAAALRGAMNEAFWQVSLRCAYTVSDGVQSAREARKLDLVVLRLEMPEWRDIEALVHIRRELPWLRVLAVCSVDDPAIAAAALEAGAAGCIPETLSLLGTAAAIRLLAEAGGIYVASSDFLRQAPRHRAGTPEMKYAVAQTYGARK